VLRQPRRFKLMRVSCSSSFPASERRARWQEATVGIGDGQDYLVPSVPPVSRAFVTYDFRGVNALSAGIETEVVTEYSGGWVPSRRALARISIAGPVSGGM
jgi:hypothetical protein